MWEVPRIQPPPPTHTLSTSPSPHLSTAHQTGLRDPIEGHVSSCGSTYIGQVDSPPPPPHLPPPPPTAAGICRLGNVRVTMWFHCKESRFKVYCTQVEIMKLQTYGRVYCKQIAGRWQADCRQIASKLPEKFYTDCRQIAGNCRQIASRLKADCRQIVGRLQKGLLSG